MDINQMPEAFRRSVHQHLTADQTFDAFVLNCLWMRLSLPTKEVLECSKTWYFGESQAAENWRVPALVILFRGASLLAQPHYWEQLLEIANHCKAITCCDRIHVIGSDSGIRLWFDYSGKQWHRQTMSLPADWQTEDS